MEIRKEKKEDEFRIAANFINCKIQHPLFQAAFKSKHDIEKEFPLNLLYPARKKERDSIWQEIRSKLSKNTDEVIHVCQKAVYMCSRLLIAQALLFNKDIKYKYLSEPLKFGEIERKFCKNIKKHSLEKRKQTEWQKLAENLPTTSLANLTEHERIDILKKDLALSGSSKARTALKEEIDEREKELRLIEEKRIKLTLSFESLLRVHDLFFDQLQKIDPQGILLSALISSYSKVKVISFLKEALQDRIELDCDKRKLADLSHNILLAIMLRSLIESGLQKKDCYRIAANISIEYLFFHPLLCNLVERYITKNGENRRDITYKDVKNLHDNYIRDGGSLSPLSITKSVTKQKKTSIPKKKENFNIHEFIRTP